MKNEAIEETPYVTGPTYRREMYRCMECGIELTSFIAYISLVGEACMECYVEAAREDEENESLRI